MIRLESIGAVTQKASVPRDAEPLVSDDCPEAERIRNHYLKSGLSGE